MRSFARAAMISFAIAATSICTGCGQHPPRGDMPEGYPPSYARILEGADSEAALVIWSATDRRQVRELLADFKTKHPRIAVSYREMPARAIHDQFLEGIRAGRPQADLLWTSAMDLQIKLVNDGYAQAYASPEKAFLPRWANWKDQAWGVTAEPIVMVLNRRLLGHGLSPSSHLELDRLLAAQVPELKGRVATYDPAASAVGHLYLSQDVSANPHMWRLIRGFGLNEARTFATTEEIIEDVSAGRSAIGYNVVGSYAIDEMRRNPNLSVVLPSDYTLVMSRIAMIPSTAPHPNAARLFLDYILSKRGQAFLAAHSMSSVRLDVATPAPLQSSHAPMRAIRVGPELLVVQDQLTRQTFMKRWRQATGDRTTRPHGTAPVAVGLREATSSPTPLSRE